jgi:hypothetical protein
MKITRRQLRQLINEEIGDVILKELAPADPHKNGSLKKIEDFIKGLGYSFQGERKIAGDGAREISFRKKGEDSYWIVVQFKTQGN